MNIYEAVYLEIFCWYFVSQIDKLLIELEEGRDLSQNIVHVDMDAFYAAVEERDNPSLKDKPMAVGSSSMLVSINAWSQALAGKFIHWNMMYTNNNKVD